MSNMHNMTNVVLYVIIDHKYVMKPVALRQYEHTRGGKGGIIKSHYGSLIKSKFNLRPLRGLIKFKILFRKPS